MIFKSIGTQATYGSSVYDLHVGLENTIKTKQCEACYHLQDKQKTPQINTQCLLHNTRPQFLIYCFFKHE
jgi:hypothetical protein